MAQHMTHKSTAAGKARTLRLRQARKLKAEGLVMGW